MKRRLILVILFCLCFHSNGWAEKNQVVKVNDDGVIELSEGEKIKLAGIEIPQEAVKIIPLLLSKQDFDIKADRDLNTYFSDSDINYVYVYVDTREVQRERSDRDRELNEKRMINELLLRIGSARVDTRFPFKYKEEFLRLEEEAKSTGQGIWSYEPEVISEAF